MFVGYEINVTEKRIFILQIRYCNELLKKYRLSYCSGIHTARALQENLIPRNLHERELDKQKNSRYGT